MELKIVTFNIRCDYGQDGPNQFCYRSSLVKRKIEAEQPDIICFQEVLPHVVQWLKENLTDYYVVGCGREKTLDGEQMTVAFRRDRINMISGICLQFQHCFLAILRIVHHSKML